MRVSGMLRSMPSFASADPKGLPGPIGGPVEAIPQA